MGKLVSIAYEAISLIGREITLAGNLPGIRTQNGHVKVKGGLIA